MHNNDVWSYWFFEKLVRLKWLNIIYQIPKDILEEKEERSERCDVEKLQISTFMQVTILNSYNKNLYCFQGKKYMRYLNFLSNTNMVLITPLTHTRIERMRLKILQNIY